MASSRPSPVRSLTSVAISGAGTEQRTEANRARADRSTFRVIILPMPGRSYGRPDISSLSITSRSSV